MISDLTSRYKLWVPRSHVYGSYKRWLLSWRCEFIHGPYPCALEMQWMSGKVEHRRKLTECGEELRRRMSALQEMDFEGLANVPIITILATNERYFAAIDRA